MRSNIGPPENHRRRIGEKAKAGEVEDVEGPNDRRIGFEEFKPKAFEGVKASHQVEGLGAEHRAARDLRDGKGQEGGHAHGFIELHRVARDAVAEARPLGMAGKIAHLRHGNHAGFVHDQDLVVPPVAARVAALPDLHQPGLHGLG